MINHIYLLLSSFTIILLFNISHIDAGLCDQYGIDYIYLCSRFLKIVSYIYCQFNYAPL